MTLVTNGRDGGATSWWKLYIIRTKQCYTSEVHQLVHVYQSSVLNKFRASIDVGEFAEELCDGIFLRQCVSAFTYGDLCNKQDNPWLGGSIQQYHNAQQ